MARSIDYTIAYDDGEHAVDLCKILLGGRRLYYVTAPYHPADRAIAAKVTVNYAEGADLLTRTTRWVLCGPVDALYVRAYDGHDSRWYRPALWQKAGRLTAADMTKDLTFEPVDGPT